MRCSGVLLDRRDRDLDRLLDAPRGLGCLELSMSMRG